MADGPRSEVATGYASRDFLRRIPDTLRNHFIACTGEFVGTAMFLFFGLGGAHVANTYPDEGASRLMYISLSFGFSLLVSVFIFFRVSGGLFNPAVTFGMVLVGAIPVVRGALVAVTQLLAGIVASALVVALLPGRVNVSTELSSSMSTVQGLFLEAFLTFQLTVTIFMMAGEKHRGTFLAPLVIGLALFVAELVGVPYTGGSLNPARSFGPQVILGQFQSYHWIYWVGPMLGSTVAAGFYKMMTILNYETANPDQDGTSKPTEGAIHLQDG